ncbi:MAG: hypothetical protein AB7F51_04085 [Pseudorhodoplanes sp.]
MRAVVAALCAGLAAGPAVAQTQADPKASDSEHSTGRTLSPDEKGVMQPQGPAGPITTGSGGAPASSPQGQTPPNMQSAPEGSSKTIVDPPKQ